MKYIVAINNDRNCEGIGHKGSNLRAAVKDAIKLAQEGWRAVVFEIEGHNRYTIRDYAPYAKKSKILRAY